MRILLTDDEKDFARSLKKGLVLEQYQVDLGFKGADALRMTKQKKYDLIILDIMLPGLDGFAVCQQLRTRGLRVPILMLTARDRVEDRVKGLDCGADDYLTKPFSLSELLARIRALTRRDSKVKSTVLQEANLILDPAGYEVKRGGKIIYLTRTEYLILLYLMRHKNQVVTRQELEKHIWQHCRFTKQLKRSPKSHPLEVYIRYLRRKIDDAYSHKLIKTVRGVGYKIKA